MLWVKLTSGEFLDCHGIVGIPIWQSLLICTTGLTIFACDNICMEIVHQAHRFATTAPGSVLRYAPMDYGGGSRGLVGGGRSLSSLPDPGQHVPALWSMSATRLIGMDFSKDAVSTIVPSTYGQGKGQTLLHSRHRKIIIHMPICWWLSCVCSRF